jgi:hypothetical protein
MNHYSGVALITLGKPFRRLLFSGYFIPYEIKYPNGSIKKHNLSLRKWVEGGEAHWFVDGGI